MTAEDLIPMARTGRVAWVFEDFFDTDRIIGVERLHDRRAHDPVYLRDCLMRDWVPDFVDTVAPGDILVAGQLFGFGHPHGQAMRAMRDVGIRTVVAESFFPPFHHNELYHGMLLLTCPGIARVARRGDTVRVDSQPWSVSLPQRGRVLAAHPLTAHEVACVQAGGERSLLLG